MYKKQMILQRIVSYLLLGAAALVFVYSLGLVTDLYDSKFSFYAQDIESPMVAGTEVYYLMQEFNQQLTGVGIALILVAVSQFVFQTHNRRRYYIANYITVCANTVAGIAASVWALDNIFKYKALFLQVDFETLKTYAEMFGFPYIESTFWFDASKVVFGILLVGVALNVISMIWKVALMSAEKRLIKQGKED
ncbi:MAG: hypothetical protein IJ282_02080 [Lachnospiraceae bacterium]|nr:hypothetical protein [Lachnospiraceae bacterium]